MRSSTPDGSAGSPAGRPAGISPIVSALGQPDPVRGQPTAGPCGDADAWGSTGAASAAAPVPRARVAPDDLIPGEVVDLGVEPSAGRRVTAFLLFAVAVVTVLAAAIAYGDPRPVTVGFSLVMLAASATLWRLRGRRKACSVLAAGSRIEVRRGRSRHVFDLADTASPVDVIGSPGRRGWRVLFYRRGLPPYVVDASIADPEAFTRVLRAHRPGRADPAR